MIQQHTWEDIRSMNSRQLVKVAIRDYGVDLGVPDKEKRGAYLQAIVEAARGANRPIPGVPVEMGGDPKASKPLDLPNSIGRVRAAPGNMEEKVELTIGEDYDPQASKFQAPCVNGVTFQITKGQRVVVPKAVAAVLQNAVATIHYKQEISPGVFEDKTREVPRFNIQIHGTVMAPRGTRIPNISTEQKIERIINGKQQANK